MALSHVIAIPLMEILHQWRGTLWCPWPQVSRLLGLCSSQFQLLQNLADLKEIYSWYTKKRFKNRTRSIIIKETWKSHSLPYVHDLNLQFVLITLIVVGVSHATNLTIKLNTCGTAFSTACVSPLAVTSYSGYPVAQSYLEISPKWTSPLMKKTPSLCTGTQ